MTLVDVCVWTAALWEKHTHHVVAKRWLDGRDDEELIFCRVTEMAVLRLLSNPAVMRDDVVSRRHAWNIVVELQQDPRVRFLQEPAGLAPLWIAFSKRDDSSHQLWTDDYLAAFAQAAHADLVTLDRSMRARYPSVDVITLQ